MQLNCQDAFPLPTIIAILPFPFLSSQRITRCNCSSFMPALKKTAIFSDIRVDQVTSYLPSTMPYARSKISRTDIYGICDKSNYFVKVIPCDWPIATSMACKGRIQSASIKFISTPSDNNVHIFPLPVACLGCASSACFHIDVSGL